MKALNATVGTGLAPYELFCQGNGRYDAAVDVLSMKYGRVSPYFTSRYISDHEDHVHVAYAD